MDVNALGKNVFLEDGNFIDPVLWSEENSLFEDFGTVDWNDDFADLFTVGAKEDDTFQEERINEPGTSSEIRGIKDEDIKNLRVGELNKLLRGLSREEAASIRRRRRNLKNRDYALACRQRRAQTNCYLFNENKKLKKQLEDLIGTLERAVEERNTEKQRFLEVQSLCGQAGLVVLNSEPPLSVSDEVVD